ncbi:ligand of Numb protein X 2-like [Homarus americanus]|uniref:ligand of Numb protein X 2-like n=1 Tax=Homarus americanus TaxID=6706 RepID=UPI001C4851F3|nr:ligand of Numb protein X 2-like [Homarus americanus]
MENNEDVGVGSVRSGRRRNCRTCGQQHQPHEPHLYDYIDDVDEDVTCHICLQPLVTPLDTPCGHTFCRPCLLSFLTVQQNCPVDRKPLSQQLCSPSSLVLKKLLEKLKVRCPNVDHCTMEMQRGDLEDHLKYRCPGNWVSCPHTTSGCDYRGSQRSITTHLTTCTYKDHGVSRPPIVEGEITHLEIPRTHTALGITIVGGSDTPLRCVVVQEVFPDGLVAQDGRLQPGDQIIEVDGVDMTSATHQVVCQALRRPQTVLRLGVYRERIEAQRTLSSTTPPAPPATTHVPQPGEAMMVTLQKESSRQLGLKLGGRRTEPGIFVMEVLEGSVAAQDGRLHPHDRILAINGADVRYARLDHASRLIQQTRHHVSLVVSRGAATSVVDSSGPPPEYQHLFRRPDPSLPVHHWRTKSAPDRLVPRLDCHGKDINKSLGDVTDGLEDDIGGSVDDVGLSASCESLDDRGSVTRREGSLLHSNGSLSTPGEPYSGSLGSLNGVNTHYQSNGSLGSMGIPLNQSSGSLASSAVRGGGPTTVEEEGGPPALPPRHRHALARTRSSDQLDPPDNASDSLREKLKETPNLDVSVQSVGSALSGGGPGVDTADGSTSSRMRGRRSRDSSDMSDLVHGFRRSLRIESTQLHQKTVTISKGGNESLGMRIGGGVGSNEGDTPIYIANINPQGPVGKSKQVKKGDVLLSVNGQSLLGLTHGQAVALLKATAELAGVTLSLLDGPETSLGSANFVPSWLYWQKLPRSLHVSKSVVLHRAPGASLGFSIVGGSDPQRGAEPIHVLFVVQSSPAAIDGKLRCGDRLLSVDGHSLEQVRHASAVSLLKQAGQRVHLEVVSWLGTEL